MLEIFVINFNCTFELALGFCIFPMLLQNLLFLISQVLFFFMLVD